MKMTPALAMATLVLALAGCASLPPTADEAPIAETLQGAGMEFEPDRLSPLGKPEALPAGELSTAQAVAWALANHPRVHEILAGLDGAAARRWQAGLLPNPMLSVMGLRSDGGGWMIEYGLMQSVLAVLQRPRRVAEADAALGQATAEAAVALLALAREVEATHLEAVTAAQREALQARRVQVLEERLELVSREQMQGRESMVEVLALQRETAAARAGLADAAVQVAEGRSALALAMGLERSAALELPARLPRPPAGGIEEAVLLDIAQRQRPDLGVAAAERERAAAARDLQGFGRGVEALDLGLRREPGAIGPELRVSVPVLDTAGARVALARSEQDQALARQVLLQRQVGVEVERAVVVLERRQEMLAKLEEAAGLAGDRAGLLARLQVGGASGLDPALRAEDDALQASMALIDARLAVWQAWLALATVTASALVEPQAED